MLTEILGKKIGMTQVFDGQARRIPVTVIEIDPVCILEKVIHPKTVKAKVGYKKVAAHRQDRVKKPLLGYFKKLNIAPYAVIRELSVSDPDTLEVAKEVGVEIFAEGDIVDVRAKSKGRGFQGGMKRHGWHGGKASHGSMTHRRMGSAGSNTTPGRVLRGHRMPGHMGNSYVTVKNLRVVKVDAARKDLYLEGAVPGAVNSTILIKKVKR